MCCLPLGALARTEINWVVALNLAQSCNSCLEEIPIERLKQQVSIVILPSSGVHELHGSWLFRHSLKRWVGEVHLSVFFSVRVGQHLVEGCTEDVD